MMPFILCQPAILRFKWELQVALTNLHQLGVKDVILLFAESDPEIPRYFERNFGAHCFVYPDKRKDKSYIPSVKPYLWWQFLQDNPLAQTGEYFYMDTDVIFRELPDFSRIKHSPTLWPGSNTESYLSPAYIRSKGSGYLSMMAQLIGIHPQQIAALEGRSAGAQWLMKNPSADYWHKVYLDSSRLYHYFSSVEPYMSQQHGAEYVPLQKWTAEMWAQLWNMVYFGIEPAIEPELNFEFATAPIEKWDKVKILHNAGVTADQKDKLFFKGQYVTRTPFDDVLSGVSPNYCSSYYVEAIREAAATWH